MARMEQVKKGGVEKAMEGMAEEGILTISSFFEVCKSIVAVNDLLCEAKRRGVLLCSEQEDWLNSDSWSESMSEFVQFHRMLISFQSKKGLKRAVERGQKIGPKFGPRPHIDRKMKLAALILEVNKEVSRSLICKVLDLSVHTFNRLKRNYIAL